MGRSLQGARRMCFQSDPETLVAAAKPGMRIAHIQRYRSSGLGSCAEFTRRVELFVPARSQLGLQRHDDPAGDDAAMMTVHVAVTMQAVAVDGWHHDTIAQQTLSTATTGKIR